MHLSAAVCGKRPDKCICPRENGRAGLLAGWRIASNKGEDYHSRLRCKMELPKTTRAAAREAGLMLAQITHAICHGKLVPPAKDETGRYLWTAADIERARQAVAVDRRRKRETVPA